MKAVDKEAVVLARMAMPELKPGQHAYKFAPAYSGGYLEVDRYPIPAVVNIDTVEFEDGMNCLLNHDAEKPLGGIVSIKKTIKNGLNKVEATAIIGNTPASRDFFELEDAQITFRPSIGLYRTNRFKETRYKHGETFQANGRTFTGPAVFIDYGIISEISQVIYGGDIDAKSVLIAQLRSKNTMSFDEWLTQEKDMTMEAFNALSQEEQDALKAEFDAIEASGPVAEADLPGFVDDEAFYSWLVAKNMTPEDYQAMDDSGKTALQEEYLASKQAAVEARGKSRHAVQQISDGRIVALQAMFGRHEDFLMDAIEKNWSPTTAKKIFRARQVSENQKRVALNAQLKTGKAMPNDRTFDTYLAGFAREFGISDEKIISKVFLGDKERAEPALTASGRKFRQGCGYTELYLSSIDSRDRKLESHHIAESNYKSAELRRKNGFKSPKDCVLKASLGFSTIDAQAIIDYVHQTFVDQQYELAEFVLERIAYTREVKDFSKIQAFKPSLLGRIQQITDSGEIPNLAFTIEKREAKAEPYGGIISIPEMYYIQDEIGLFKDILNMLAKEAAIAFEDDGFRFVRQMMKGEINANDGLPFFSIARGNIMTGATSSFSTNGLSGARLAFTKLRNKNYAPVMVSPKNLIVPPALEPAALLIFQSQRTNAVNDSGDAQIYSGIYNPITSPFLGSGNTGDAGDISDTSWLLSADPNSTPFIEILKVSGFGSPRVESSVMDLAVWGTKMRVLFPYGFSVGDPFGAVLSKGV